MANQNAEKPAKHYFILEIFLIGLAVINKFYSSITTHHYDELKHSNWLQLVM